MKILISLTVWELWYWRALSLMGIGYEDIREANRALEYDVCFFLPKRNPQVVLVPELRFL